MANTKPAQKEWTGAARIHSDRFKVADFTIGDFDAKVEMGTTKEDLLNPAFWSHVAENMTPWSRITVRAEDGTFYAQLLVLDCGRGHAKMRLLNWWDLTTADVAATQSATMNLDDFSIEWKGATKKAVVIRKADQVVLQEGLPSKGAAEVWLKNFILVKPHTENRVDEMPA